MPELNPFSSWLAEQIDRSRLKMKEVADAAGLSPGYLSMLQKGNKARPSRETVQKIAVAFARLLDKPEVELIESAFVAAGLESPPRVGPMLARKSNPRPNAFNEFKWTPPQPPGSIGGATSDEHLRESTVIHRPDLGVVLRLEHLAANDGGESQWMVFALDQAEGTVRNGILPACSVGWFADGHEIAACTLNVGQTQKLMAPPCRIWEFHILMFGPSVTADEGYIVLTRQWAVAEPKTR